MSRLVVVALLIAAVLLWWLSPARAARRRPPSSELDETDPEQLEAAENEVRDLGAQQAPDAGFEGDDWGPGTANRR